MTERFEKEKLTPIEKIDEVLSVLKNSKGLIAAELIYDVVQIKYLIEFFEVSMIIEKLVRDNYVHLITDRIGGKKYAITLEGFLFIGYGNQEKVNKANEIIACQNEERIIRNETWLLRGTWAASIIGAFLLLWQIWLWFYPHYCDLHCR